MDIIRFSIDNPVKVSVGVILVLLFGLISFTIIPVLVSIFFRWVRIELAGLIG